MTGCSARACELTWACVRQGEKLVGQVDVTDILGMAGQADESMLDMPISQYMACGGICSEAVTCAADITVLALMELFAETRTHRIFAVTSRPHRVLPSSKSVVPDDAFQILGVATLAGLYRAICGLELRREGVDLEDGEGSIVDATAGVEVPSAPQ